ncbi:MAG: hypothetical protein ACLFPL_03230 [Candidatus Nanoarchaeia archaeon]
MKHSIIDIIHPSISDLSVALDIEKKAWGALEGQNMTAQEDAFAYRLSNQMCSLALVNGNPAGLITAYSPDWLKEVDFDFLTSNQTHTWEYISEHANLPNNWDEATVEGNLTNYDPNVTDALFLVGVGVDPNYRGNKLVDKLIQHTIMKNTDKNILGYGRLPSLGGSFSQYPCEENVNNYLCSKRADGLPVDYGQRFHVRNGANAICSIPNAMQGDSECYDYGFLAHYPQMKK